MGDERVKRIFVLSRCLKFSKNSSLRAQKGTAIFHFKGYYHGHPINTIFVESEAPQEFFKGEDYLLFLWVQKVEEGKLFCKVLQAKGLRDISNYG